MSRSNEDVPRESFGPYEVFERLGVGGMASVHRAVKRGIEDFERVVALKRLLSHLAEDESFVKSFVREARLASKLQHANIIQLYDLGRVERVYYIAMEYVRGRDLRKVLKQTAYATGPMPVPMMLSLTQQLCDALDYAHSLCDENGEPLGIVHRDISPSNLLVAADGHLKVIDFGIAKATASSLRTSSGRVKGKFAYMAPESIKGQPLDHRSDLFSAGIVAYEMLTARPLFASRNEYDTLQKIAYEEVPPPSHLNPDCPPALDEIVLTALAKSADERWQSAGAMHRALDHVVKKHALQATPREIAEWVNWAFEQPLQRTRVRHKGLRQRIKERFRTHDDEITNKKPFLRSSTSPVDVGALDRAKIEIVWGNDGASVAPGSQAESPQYLAGVPPGTQRTPPATGLTPPASVATPPGTLAARPGPSAVQTGRQISSRIKRESAPPPGGPPLAALAPEHALPGWAAGTPESDQAGQTTSSFRVTMLGLAPPPEIERLRAERTGGHPVAATDVPLATAPELSSEVTSELPPEAILAEVDSPRDDSMDLLDTQRRRRPAALAAPAIEAAIEAAIEPASPSPRVIPAPLPTAMAPREVAYPTTNLARPYYPNSELDRVPRNPTFRIIQIVVLAALCIGATIVGYLLVAGGSSQPVELPPDGQAAPGDARSSSSVPSSDGGASVEAAAETPADAARGDVVTSDGGTLPVVASEKVERLSGKPPRVRSSQMTGEDGKPVLIRARLCIDSAGMVTTVDITDAPRALVKRSQRAFKDWRYKPFEERGQATAVCFDIAVEPRDS